MTAFDHILIPLDGSQAAEAAVTWVRFLPSRQITLLRVCPPRSEESAAAMRYLEDAAARLCPPDREIATQMVAGGAAEAIVAAAAGADLVVMSTQGASGGGRLLYGSVADRVARHSPTPTLLLRGGHRPVLDAPLRRVVVPLDGSPAAERALPLAARLARMLDCAVHLVTVRDRDGGNDLSRGETDPSAEAATGDEAAARAELEQVAERVHEDGVSVATQLCYGAPERELLALVGLGDLLVITTHGRGAARRWHIGSVAEKLLRQATAPLILVRADVP